MDRPTDETNTPGDETDEKLGGQTADAGHPQPTTSEVESARTLEMDAADRLTAEGVQRDDVRRLADEYIALDLGQGTDDFVAWVRQRREGGNADGGPEGTRR